MDAIVAILRASHCKSVHHYFAIDSLCEVTTDQGLQLVNMLLKHHGQYLQGAKAPDTVFKDFENHVVHVQDGYWGGAAKTANKWLTAVNQRLRAGDWGEAAYAIGVLSHYFTDPFMPLHTAQSPRETTLHRPLEWSVCCAYRDIYDIACDDPTLDAFELPLGDNWLTDAIHSGARICNQYYDLLLDDYDITESRRFPTQALGPKSRRALSQIFVWVLTAWSSALDRIAVDCGVDIPSMSLALPTVLATSKTPLKKIAHTIEDSEQRKEVERMLDEYLITGKVVKNVPMEQRVVKKIRQEQPNLKPSQRDIQRVESEPLPLPSNDRVDDPQGEGIEAPTIDEQFDEPELLEAPDEVHEDELPRPEPKQPRLEKKPIVSKPQKVPEPAQGKSVLSDQSPIVDAPAIGPKTAARLEAIGCHTIEDFLSRDADELAEALRTSWIKPDVVENWQIQASLACCIERLSAAGAGLLVMIGIHTPSDLAERSVDDVHASMVKAAKTKEGERLLRSKGPPPKSLVQRWITSAQSACGV